MKKQMLVLLTVSGLTHLSLQGAQKHAYENVSPTPVEKSMAHAYVNIPTAPAVPPRRGTSISTPCAKSIYVNVVTEDQTPPSIPARRSTLPSKPATLSAKPARHGSVVNTESLFASLPGNVKQPIASSSSMHEALEYDSDYEKFDPKAAFNPNSANGNWNLSDYAITEEDISSLSIKITASSTPYDLPQDCTAKTAPIYAYASPKNTPAVEKPTQKRTVISKQHNGLSSLKD